MADTKQLDCCYTKENYYFRYRTGAIIVRDGKMLFVKSMFENHYCYMLGGGVHLGEDSKSCIEREAFEETGVHCKAKQIAIICENFFYGIGGNIDGKECHVLEYYYLMEFPEDAEFKTITDEGENLVWVPIEEFENTDIRPGFLKETLKDAIAGKPLMHVIFDQRKM